MRSLLLLASAFLACNAQASLTLALHPTNENCGNANGTVTAEVAGGVEPYTFLWSTGSTAYQITGLVAGTYSVTVTDAASTQLTDQVTITNSPTLEIFPEAFLDGIVQVSTVGNYACPGQCNGGFGLPVNYTPSAVLPLSYDPAPYYSDPGQWGGAMFTGYCAGENPVVTITDASGCSGTFTFSAPGEVFWTTATIIQVDGACGNTGAITVDVGENCYCDVQLMSASFIPIGPAFGMSNGPYTFNGLPAGEYHIQRTSQLAYGGCPETLDATVPDLGPDCGVVSGRVFLDHDQDCVQDAGDEGIPYRVLTISPGPEYAITSGDGSYERGLVFGSYLISQDATDVEQLCPGSTSIPINLQSGTPNANVDFADSSLVPLDVSVSMTSTDARPGFGLTYYMGGSNASGQLSGTLDASFTFDPSLTLVNAWPAPTSTGSGSVTWSGMQGLGAFAGRSFTVQLQVPASTVIGSVLGAGFTVSQPVTETTLTNNTTGMATTVTGSFDPNDKTARTSSGTSANDYVIGTDNYIDYTIRFQNTGTDTAFTVVVTDTLAEELDMASFEQGIASHPFSVAFRTGRVVEWTFANILLPDSNTHEAASHGLVGFRIRPVVPLLPGTLITNAADIYFDFNDPVRTDDAVLLATLSTAVSAMESEGGLLIFPQPASDRIHVRLKGGVPTSEYRLLQIDGRPIRSGRLDPDGVDLGDLSPGGYVLAVRTAHGWTHARLVKE